MSPIGNLAVIHSETHEKDLKSSMITVAFGWQYEINNTSRGEHESIGYQTIVDGSTKLQAKSEHTNKTEHIYDLELWMCISRHLSLNKNE